MTINPLKPSYQPSVFSTDVVMVRSLSDLPAPTDSYPAYIQLADYTSYCLDGTLRLPVGVSLRLGLNNVIFANVRSQGGIIGNTPTLGVFDAPAACGDFHLRDISVSQTGVGPVWSQSVESTGIVRIDRALITCSGGSIGSFRFAAFIATNTIALGFANGFVLSQAATGVGLVFEDNSFVQAVGGSGNAVIDLGTAVFGGIRFLHSTISSAAGGIGIKGAAASANLPVGGVATAFGTRFIGAGTHLSGIVPNDIRWQLIGTQNVRSSATYGIVSMTGNATVTTPLVIGTFLDIAGTSALTSGAPRFDNGGSDNNKIRYLGELETTCRVRIDLLVTKAAVGTDEMSVRLTRNGILLGSARTAPITAALLGQSIGFEEPVFDFVANDVIGVQIANNTALNALLVTSCSIAITSVVF